MAAPTTIIIDPKTVIWSAVCIGMSGESMLNQLLMSSREVLDCEVRSDRKKGSIHKGLLIEVRGLRTYCRRSYQYIN